MGTGTLAVAPADADPGLSPSWGTGGVQCASGGFGRDIELLSNGSILTAGYYNSGFHMVVNRTLSTGLPDTSFDSDGTRVINDFIGTYSSSRVEDIVVMSDGDLMLIGFGQNVLTSKQDIMIVRLTSTGSLDTTFNGTGLLTLDPSSNDDLAYAGVELSDGDVVITGVTSTSLSNNDLYMARINSNGSLDSSFGGDGDVVVDIQSGDEYLDVVKRPDGTFLVAGKSGARMSVAAINASGSLDTSFNSDGLASMSALVGDAHALALQSDGKIVVTGSATNGSANAMVVARLTSNGDLDNSFDSDGFLFLDAGLVGYSQVAYDVLALSDGKIVAGGFGYDPATTNNTQLFIHRLTSSGSVDLNFNSSDTPGYVRAGVNSLNADDEVRALVADSTGRIFAATRTWDGSGWCIGVARFDTTLTPTSWTDQTLATGQWNTSYSDSVASNIASATYSLASGTLPAGLTLASTGTISGTPTTFGSFPITIRATTGSGTLDLSTTVSVNRAPAPTDATLVAFGTTGSPYSDQLTATGFPTPTYAVTSGALPTGITLNANTGAIAGTPTVGGIFTFTVTASNGVGSPHTFASKTITVAANNTFTTVTPARVADTRDNTGGVGTTKIGNGTGGGAPLTFHVLGTGNVPASGVAAVSLNVTAVDGQVGDEGGYV
ncbi:MAG: putative Ig domain-containing protein, partial [Actinomycetota bacterium]